MRFDSLDNENESNFDDSVNFRDILDKYLIHFKWFVISIIAFLVIAFFKLRHEIPRYEVSAKILIKDKEEGSSVNELGAFEDLGIFSSGNNSLENEIHILTSRRLMMKVVDELKLNIRYFIEDSPYDLEQYPNFPVLLNFVEDANIENPFEKKINNISAAYSINVINKNEFEFIDEDNNSLGIKNFGKAFTTLYGSLVVDLNESYDGFLRGKTILVSIRRLNAVVDMYNNSVSVEPIDDKSRVISIILNESIINKGISLINNLIEQYNADAVEDKNQVYLKTTEFLNDRIVLITSELNAIESTAEQFKSSKGLIDTRAGADIYLQSSSANENKLIDANTQLQLIDYMEAELNNGNINELLPANIGLSNPSIVSLIGEYNILVLQRKRVSKSSTELNPLIVNIDSQIKVLKSNLLNSLNSLRSTLNIEIEALNTQRGKIGSKIASVPKNEKEFKDIVRQQETKNAVYLFLLQKREESILSNAITVDKARVINKAYSNGAQVSPLPGVTYFAAFLLGLLLPAGIIFLKDTLDTKVHDEKDLKNLRMPYLGDIPLASSKKDIFIKDGDSSNIAEAFRYIRTNISFMLDNKKMGKTIFVTSTQSKEGKTMTAINLASSLAISGKKTLLVGIDLRAPKITKYKDLEDILGVSNFITNKELDIDDIIEKKSGISQLHIINSGDIPPNPVELLMSSRVEEIFDHVQKEYEYIIVDTAPVGMVTDTIQVGKFADITIYVVKANYLDKRKLHIPQKLYKENKLKNMAILINGSDHSKGAYGYGYGYGKKKEKPWYKLF